MATSEMKRTMSSQWKQTKISAFCCKQTQPTRGTKTKRAVSDDENDVVIVDEMSPKKSTKRPRQALQEVASQDNKANEEVDDVTGFDDDWSKDPFMQTSPSPAAYELAMWPPVTGIVLDAKKVGATQTIVLEETKSKVRGECVLQDAWAFLELSAGDTVTVSAVQNQGVWQVDAKNGYVSLSPEVLISSTTLSGAMFCQRRAVLGHHYKGLDPQNRVMAVGQMVHETLQKSLTSDAEVNQIVEDAIQNNLQDVFSCGMTVGEARKDVQAYIPPMREFLDTYVTKKGTPRENNFKGHIAEVVDIEESVTATRMGLKGRIDVTVEVDRGCGRTRMPLELKTGRASFSSEHRSQVALYTMMMTEMGTNVDSGLLLYLRDGILQEVVPTATEKRDLLILRSQFVRALHNFTAFQALPEPIRSAKACSACAYLTVCTAHLRSQGLENLSENHPIRTLVNTSLTIAHIDYFIFWTKLACLENAAEDLSSDKDSVMTNLTLQEVCVNSKGEFAHTFVRIGSSGQKLCAGSFVSIRSSASGNFSFGRLTDVTSGGCSLVLDKNLTTATPATYTITMYKGSVIFNTSLTNLGALLEPSREHLRSIIIDKKPAEVEEKIGKGVVSEECMRLLKPLNPDQRRAVLKVLAAKDYLLVQGPPGTGKTQTIVALVQVLAGLGQSVLIVGHTHSCVDNILLRLPPDLPFVRFGSLHSINPKLHSRAFRTLVEGCTTTEDIAKIYEHSIMASTCLGVDVNMLARKQFDVCVVDESSQALQPEVLRPLFCSKKFILIGDSKQLAPVVKSREALKMGMGESLFERLDSGSSTITLKLQYRMNQELTDLANRLTYEDQLACATEEVRTATLRVEDKSRFQELEEWVRQVLSTDMRLSVVFLDTGFYFTGEEAVTTKPHCSELEAGLIRKLVSSLIALGVTANDIGVMAPYRMQVELLKKTLGAAHAQVEVNTVDQYQGRDKEVVLYSCTKENLQGAGADEMELMGNMRRLTVAVTRAKHKLVLLGDRRTVLRYKPMALLLNGLAPHQLITLQDGVDGFSIPLNSWYSWP